MRPPDAFGFQHDPEKEETGFPSGQTRSVGPEIMLMI
jgi:hypothetical protein